ncbi:hypothetical protein ALC57_05169 [Trachymyrmex cornetzi]|uniref:Uncharacterized protein n=1 Tax=Trachymyrmex cornetzi TaxID=471704 RepID=A0A151JBI7_9HYME|nr:hypothetical protein ALC57_05169 [Trachymyrmex cornetzi]
MLAGWQYILQRKEGSIGEEDMAQHGRGVGVGIHVKAGRRGTPRAALQAQRSMHPRSSPFAVAAAAATAAATVTAAASVDELVTFCAILDR